MRDRGFVLVNALVLVAALAASAVFLLAQAELGRVRLMASRTSAQLSLHLDAAEALAVTRLDAAADGQPDHLGRAWARSMQNVALDTGEISIQIQDLQGRFNLNWLTNPSNTAASAAFDRLLNSLGVSDQDGATIRAFLQPGGPSNTSAFLRVDPPLDPVGGALLMVQQLDQLPGLSERARARLRPHLTALPGDSRLNPNTATQDVLTAFLPRLTSPRIAQLIAQRSRQPFPSTEAFLIAAQLAISEDPDAPEPEEDELLAQHLSVSSEWFGLEAVATLDGHHASRIAVLHREGVPVQTKTEWRMTTRP